MQDNYQLLIEKLDAFIRKYYKNQLVRGGIYSFTLSLVFYLVVATLEHFGHFDTTLRTILFYSFIGGFAFIIGKFIVIPLMHLYRFGKVISHEQAATIIGLHFSNVEDKLLNVLQLKKQSTDDPDQRHHELLIAGINQKVDELKPVPFVSAINLNDNRKYMRYAILPVFALILILFTAPSILKEFVRDYFADADDVPFMEKVYLIKETMRSKIPAVTHVDGTGRLQTVDAKTEPKYHALISAFNKKTGVPILLNTSFNENEPIVNSPANALDCFLRTKMDMLVIGNFIVSR